MNAPANPVSSPGAPSSRGFIALRWVGIGKAARAIFSTHHRNIGFGYLLISVVAVVLGTLLSLVMRLHLAWPDWPLPLHGPILPEEYLALVTMHGTLMLFFVLTVAPQSGFGNLILPSQLGARRMVFPRLNAAGMWLTAAALLVLLAAFFVPAGAPISGWTAYPPLSASALTGPGQGAGMDCWLASIALFSIASTISAVNTLTTIVKLRCDGLTWERLPLTVWGWFTAALLSVLAFSVLLAALLLLFCDRHLHSGFFLPSQDLISGVMLQHRGDGSPLLWLHLFWFFGHPEVYIAILPGMGLTSMVLANFARRRVFAYRLMIATTLLIGFLGILVWGHHMFVAGLNPFAGTAFSVASLAIAVPASAKVLSWLATVWGSRQPQPSVLEGTDSTTARVPHSTTARVPYSTTARVAHSSRSSLRDEWGTPARATPSGTPRFSTPMLFALGFVSLFITGGLSGPILAQPILDEYLHNTFFVVAHFHLIMAMAGIFGIFCAIYYWAPLLFHRLLSEPLGKLHFWGTFIGAYSTFLPMHFTGLAAEPRHYAQLGPSLHGLALPGTALLESTLPLQRHITYGALFLACAQLPFLINLLLAIRRPVITDPNPWQATTMEWAPQITAPQHALSGSTAPPPENPHLTPSQPAPEPVVYREPCHYSLSGEQFLPQWSNQWSAPRGGSQADPAEAE
jgi:cytochrome c oxidase subunit 1